ncbi:hypothetical protein CXQ82_06260 [Pseudomonas sp. S09G 359]|nr:hypothetical protein CXQ82_06260 [Pseudomonas sp. S09G 359]
MVQSSSKRQFYLWRNRLNCGSWLACDSGGSVDTAIAGKPAPTLTVFQQWLCVVSYLPPLPATLSPPRVR